MGGRRAREGEGKEAGRAEGGHDDHTAGRRTQSEQREGKGLVIGWLGEATREKGVKETCHALAWSEPTSTEGHTVAQRLQKQIGRAQG